MNSIETKVPWRTYLIRIILPAISAITLLLAAFFVVIIPVVEKNSMDRKREMIRELTTSAWNILAKFAEDEHRGILTKEQAQKSAIEQIANLHYGQQMKDYFWINDMHPRMIIHPYRQDLVGKDLRNYTDSDGKRVFVEFVSLVQKHGEGFVTYRWQWMDDPSTSELKISYVKGFMPWGWIIGTGIYYDDVKIEITSLQRRLFEVTGGVMIIITVLLGIIMRQAYTTLVRQRRAEAAVRFSEEKYRTLVESAGEGMFLASDEKLLHVNKSFAAMLDYEVEELLKVPVSALFSGSDAVCFHDFLEQATGQDAAGRQECSMVTREGTIREVLLSLTPVSVGGLKGVMAVVADITGQKNRDHSVKRGEEVYREIAGSNQVALQYFCRPLTSFPLTPLVTCSGSATLRETVSTMMINTTDAVLVACDNGRQGVITSHDITRFCTRGDTAMETTAAEVCSSPLHTLPVGSTVLDAWQCMENFAVSHLFITDAQNTITGLIRSEDIVPLRNYSPAVLAWETKTAASPGEVMVCNASLPYHIAILLDCGAEPHRVNRIITGQIDTVVNRYLELAIELLGEPPVPFSFVVFGSQARLEQTLVTDQDNGIIFNDVPAEQLPLVEQYFLALGEKVCTWLNDTGYSYCDGNVMAKNPEWCKPVSVWKEYFQAWVNDADAENLLRVKTFFDMRHLYGDVALFMAMQEHLMLSVRDNNRFFQMLARNILPQTPPIGLFGNFITEQIDDNRTALDMKSAMMPVVDYGRIFALKYGIASANTLERLKELAVKGVIHSATYREIVQAYNHCMRLRLTNQSDALESGVKKPDNYVTIKDLTKIDRKILREVFNQVKNVQVGLSYEFTGSASTI